MLFFVINSPLKYYKKLKIRGKICVCQKNFVPLHRKMVQMDFR